ncbi:uncharacterized protein LOC105432085 [Pogonomyrmex barbatus]|uniref:Uncharacterized protein LOC105432085 n=1 Tax=Pogonomyrmex barbatus TaxID=144034 RepID=A0A6I9WPF7_9HYME|nr:uncharacterized protein LOC105432085 [Pogonomyrmex barbatus]
MLESRVLKPENSLDYEQKAVSSLVQGNLPIKSRQRRVSSDQRRAELETLMTLSNITHQTQGKRSLVIRGNRQIDPVKIGRRRRFAVDQIPTELASIKVKHSGDPAYPLIS